MNPDRRMGLGATLTLGQDVPLQHTDPGLSTVVTAVGRSTGGDQVPMGPGRAAPEGLLTLTEQLLGVCLGVRLLVWVKPLPSGWARVLKGRLLVEPMGRPVEDRGGFREGLHTHTHTVCHLQLKY